MTSYSSVQSAAIAEIRLAGLNPDVIRIWGANHDGYDEFVVDAHGKRVIDEHGEALTIRKPWPAAFQPGGGANLDTVLRYTGIWEDAQDD